MDYLLAENLSCIRGSNTVFKNLSFKVSRGQILQITGANGSGKTSLLRMIAGFIYPSEGKIIPENHYTHKDVHFVGQKVASRRLTNGAFESPPRRRWLADGPHVATDGPTARRIALRHSTADR